MNKFSETKIRRMLIVGLVAILACALLASDGMAQRRGNSNGRNGLFRRRATVTPIAPAPESVPVPNSQSNENVAPEPATREKSVLKNAVKETEKKATPAVEEAPSVVKLPVNTIDAENVESVESVENKVESVPEATIQETLEVLDLTDENELQAEAVEAVLEKSDDASEIAPVLKQIKPEDIRNAVDEATTEVELDNQNQEINDIVENSLSEVNEGDVDESVARVLESSDDDEPEIDAEDMIDIETEDVTEDALEEDADEEDVLPAPVQQIVEESGIDDSEEIDAETTSDELPASELKVVKMAELDEVLTIPTDATFDELVAFVDSLQNIRPSDLNAEDAEVQEQQINEFIQKILKVRLAVSEQMLTLKDLTEEQWETAVSLKVQALASLFRLDATYVETLRTFTEEIADRASVDLFWNVEAVLIQMELCKFQEEPEADILKEHVSLMLAHTKKGIEQKCLNADFALATVQMVLLAEEKLPKVEVDAIFAETIEILNASEDEKLHETARFLENIQKQQEMKGKTVDLTLTTYDGKTLNTADYVDKTLLLHCFSFASQDDLQDLGLIYQLFMAYHDRGLEVIGIVAGKKVDEMDDLLKQIPWPMVFVDAETNDEDSVFEKLAVSVLPSKILINTTGTVEDPNADSMSLMKYLQAIYGEPIENADTVEEVEEVAEDAEYPEDAENTEDVEDAEAIEEIEELVEEATEEALESVEEIADEQNPDDDDTLELDLDIL